MKKELQAIAPLIAMLAILAAALLLLAAGVNADRARWAIPPPENVAEGFVQALSAHRYTGALGQLSQDLQKQVDEATLKEYLQPVEDQHQGIQDAHGLDSQQQGEQAAASVQVKLGDNQETTIEFPLKKENGEWKIESIDPLLSLAE